ncbi:MAG: alpha/beta-type small acid-soluble spore protein [Firmicutes bacterium]|nr:alpha/beta-type small acid-soluble spore protein [Bacillota bacterium]
MARRRKRKNKITAPEAAGAVDDFKFEIASELGVHKAYKRGYWGNVSCRQCGDAGGQMIRGMIASAEQSLREQEGGFKQRTQV